MYTFLHKLTKFINGWTLGSFILTSMMLLPLLFLFIYAWEPASEYWSHLVRNLLKDYIVVTCILVIFTMIMTVGVGIILAWLISAYDFPLRRIFAFVLVLPLALPPYIAAYTYQGLLSYTGTIQSFWRNQFGITFDQRYFDIMNVQGSVFIFSICLFPYVLILVRAFLEKQSASLIESARLLGKSGLQIFFHIVIPISRIAWIGGGSLVALEVLNDFGVVKYFGIPTFSSAIFTTWFGIGDTPAALKLSLCLMGLVFGILILEKWLRGRKQYHFSNTQVRPLVRIKLSGWKAFSATTFCLSVAILSLGIPILQLCQWSLLAFDSQMIPSMFELAGVSLISTTLASIFIVGSALILANTYRFHRSFGASWLAKMTILGYSIPGAVIAMGIIITFMRFDDGITNVLHFLDIDGWDIVMSGSIVMLFFAYMIRFMGIAFQSIEAGFAKSGRAFHDASRTLGYSRTRTFFKVDLPLVRASLLSGWLLVSLDLLKELPLTLILRPFNYHTLATKTFEYASDERIIDAAIPSLMIIGLGIVILSILNRIQQREKSYVY